MKRFLFFATAAAIILSTDVTQAGEWSRHQWVDDMTDEQHQAIATQSLSGLTMTIDCNPRSLGDELFFHEFAHVMNDSISIRLDNREAVYFSTGHSQDFRTLWLLSHPRTGYINGKRYMAIMDQDKTDLSGANTLRIRASEYAGRVVDEVFDLAGYDEAATWLKTTCKRPQSTIDSFAETGVYMAGKIPTKDRVDTNRSKPAKRTKSRDFGGLRPRNN